jgi:molybdate transport system regulatory protein
MSNKIPGESYSENINARFWLTGNATYLGIGRITLLEKIAENGSIKSAAKAMNMSYKKAWQLTDEINRMYDKPLIIKEKGGKLGGGTKLTRKGEEAVRVFRELEKKFAKCLITESHKINL